VKPRARSRVWVVRPEDGTRLGDVLPRAGADAAAVAEGRVFVGRTRARSLDELVRAGDEVTFTEEGALSPDVVILVDEDGLVAADKPAHLATIPDHAGSTSNLLARVAAALGTNPGELHATSRLDRGVSGVVVFARTVQAQKRLHEARDQGTYVRRYVAIAAQAPAPPHGQWDAPIGRAKDPRHRAAFGRDPAEALSRYAVIAVSGGKALLALEPVTGRTHQLRVHAAHAGAPLLGDRTYGGPSRLTLPTGRVIPLDRIALHAARVRVPRADGSLIEVVAPVPEELCEWWRALGGEQGAWERALVDEVV
jgi:23S rRNA pseudouridine1911/1915/1917 synthase